MNTDLKTDEIIENLNFLSKAELLDCIYDEVFNRVYTNNFDEANIKACKAIESVEDYSSNELVQYIIDTFL